MTAAARAYTGTADERQPARGHNPKPESKAPAVKRLEARTSLEMHAYIEHAAAISGVVSANRRKFPTVPGCTLTDR